jgi:hypothetical protein
MSHDEDKRQYQKCICCGADTIWEAYGIPVCGLAVKNWKLIYPSTRRPMDRVLRTN